MAGVAPAAEEEFVVVMVVVVTVGLKAMSRCCRFGTNASHTSDTSSRHMPNRSVDNNNNREDDSAPVVSALVVVVLVSILVVVLDVVAVAAGPLREKPAAPAQSKRAAP